MTSATSPEITQLQAFLSIRLDRIEQRLSVGAETLKFFDEALAAYRERERTADLLSYSPHKLLAAVLTDTDLKFHHRKIIEFLYRQYSFHERSFKEVAYNQLVRGARVCNARAKRYLSELQEKGFVTVRNDNYRVWTKINQETFQ